MLTYVVRRGIVQHSAYCSMLHPVSCGTARHRNVLQRVTLLNKHKTAQLFLARLKRRLCMFMHCSSDVHVNEIRLQ